MEIENILKQILSERGLQPRPHQVRNILDYITPDKPHVAAIATAGGKTFMTAAKFELYYRCGLLKKTNKVLILPADKTILRGNFVEQFDKFFEKGEKSFTYCGVKNKTQLIEAVENDIQVIIGLPQLIKDHTKLLKNVKWLVVDESHKWYFADTIRNIIKDITPKKGTLHQFLLTGTPFKFNLHKNNYIIDYTSVKTLYEQGFIGDVNMQVLHTSLALSRMDWVSMTDNLRSDKRINKEDLDRSFTEVIEELVKKLKLPFKKLSTAHNISNNAMSVFGKLQKTIIFTHGIEEAECVYGYLKNMNVNCLISHSERKESSEKTFDLFKDKKSIKVLVVVNQGKEGFDFPELYNIIDMTYSQNFEVVMQMVGRLLRPSEGKTFKVFYKVAPRNTSGYFTDWMDCMIQLFDDYWYSNFNGRNTLDIRVPNALLNRPKQPKTPTFIQDGNKKIEISSGSSLSKGTKIQVVGADNKKEPLKDGTYKVPQTPTNNNPKPAPIEIEVKKGVITKTTAPTTRGRMIPKNLQTMGFDNSLSFMEKNDWFRLEDPLSTVATTTLRKVIYKFGYKMDTKGLRQELNLPWEECRDVVRKKGFTSQTQFNTWEDRPDEIPSNPQREYVEWTNWPDFLGTKIGWTGGYKTKDEVVEYIKSIGVKSDKEWRLKKKEIGFELPIDIPAEPGNVFKEEWSWTLVSGSGKTITKTKDLWSFKKSKQYAIKLNLKKKIEWKKINHPYGVPKRPDLSYINEWKDWDDFLGIKKIVLTKNQILDAQSKFTNIGKMAKYLNVPYKVFVKQSEELGLYKKMSPADRNRLISANRKSNGVNAKEVIQYDLKGNKLKEWKSVKIAADKLGFGESNIRSSMFGGRQSTAYGYIWKYVE
jgi:superfamily II DNA or RNA helicase